MVVAAVIRTVVACRGGAKSLAGEADLFELWPRQGSSKARPLVVRRRDGYLIVAVAADHANDMRRAVADAHERLEARGELAE